MLFRVLPKDYEVRRTKGADGKDEVIHPPPRVFEPLRRSLSAWTLPTSRPHVNAREMDKPDTEGNVRQRRLKKAQREAEEKALEGGSSPSS